MIVIVKKQTFPYGTYTQLALPALWQLAWLFSSGLSITEYIFTAPSEPTGSHMVGPAVFICFKFSGQCEEPGTTNQDWPVFSESVEGGKTPADIWSQHEMEWLSGD